MAEKTNQIKSQYEDVGSFVDGICWVKHNGLWGQIDYNGNEVTPFTYHGHHAIKGVLIVGKEGAFGAIDGNGNHVLPEVYDRIEEIVLEKAPYHCCSKEEREFVLIPCAIKEERYLILDSHGHPCSDEPFDELYCEQPCDWFSYDSWHTRPFQYYDNKLYVARIEGETTEKEPKRKVGVFDVKGNRMLLPCIYDNIEYMPPWTRADYLVARREGKSALIDKQWKETMRLEYDEINYRPHYEGKYPFEDGEYLIPARKGDSWGYINVEGVVKIPFRYSMASPFVDGKALVSYISHKNDIPLYDWTKGRMDCFYIDHHGNKTEK